MDTPSDARTLDLDALERRVARRACWHEDPAAYRQGVHDAMTALRDEARRGGQPVWPALAG